MSERDFPVVGSPVVCVDLSDGTPLMKGIITADLGVGRFTVSCLDGRVLTQFGDELLPDENFDVASSWRYIKMRDGHMDALEEAEA